VEGEGEVDDDAILVGKGSPTNILNSNAIFWGNGGGLTGEKVALFVRDCVQP
jgi:hypothetical protein